MTNKCRMDAIVVESDERGVTDTSLSGATLRGCYTRTRPRQGTNKVAQKEQTQAVRFRKVSVRWP